VIVTVDTNVLVSGVFFAGVPGKIVTAAREGVFTLAITPLLLDELRQVFSRAKFGLNPDAVQLLMDDMEASATIVSPEKRAQLRRAEITRISESLGSLCECGGVG